MSKTASELLSELTQNDTYGILCSFLYDLKQIPKYSTISEMCYMMKPEDLKKFLTYFAGRTVTFPTKDEFNEAMQTLKLYQYYRVENRPWKECVILAGFDSGHGKKAKNLLAELEKTLETYNIGNRVY